VLPRGASSKEKAIWAIHPRSSERGILAFSREASHAGTAPGGGFFVCTILFNLKGGFQ
jgi:hypothetical protein